MELSVDSLQYQKLKELAGPDPTTRERMQKTVSLIIAMFSEIPEVQKILLQGLRAAWIRNEFKGLTIHFAFSGGKNSFNNISDSLPVLMNDSSISILCSYD